MCSSTSLDISSYGAKRVRLSDAVGAFVASSIAFRVGSIVTTNADTVNMVRMALAPMNLRSWDFGGGGGGRPSRRL